MSKTTTLLALALVVTSLAGCFSARGAGSSRPEDPAVRFDVDCSESARAQMPEAMFARQCSASARGARVSLGGGL